MTPTMAENLILFCSSGAVILGVLAFSAWLAERMGWE